MNFFLFTLAQVGWIIMIGEEKQGINGNIFAPLFRKNKKCKIGYIQNDYPMGVLYPQNQSNGAGVIPKISLRYLFDHFFEELTDDFDISKEVQPYSFFEAKPFLENNNISVEMRIKVARGVPMTEIHEVEKFLRQWSIPLEIRREIKVRSGKKLREYILKCIDTDHDKQKIALELMARMEPIKFDENIDFIRKMTEKLGTEIDRGALSEKIIFDFPFEAFFGEIGLEKVAEAERKKNIQAVNEEQYSLASGDLKEILDTMDLAKRSLVFYYRGISQGVYFPHFLYMLECIKRYIEGGYSHLFNTFTVTSRDKDRYPHRYRGNYTYRSGADFRNLCSLYSNTINITHGSPGAHSGSIPILGRAIVSDDLKMNVWGRKEYILLPLLYHNSAYSDPPFPKLSVRELLTILLRTVQELENAQIKKALSGKTESGK